MPCLSYTVHLTLYTPCTESKNIFFIFDFSFYFERSGLSTLSSFAAVYSIRMAIFVIFDLYPFISRSVFISFYLLSPRPRAYLIYIHAKPTRRRP